MFGFREAGVLGASVALAGGLAYLIWNYASSYRENKPEQDGKSAGEGKEETGGEEAEQTIVVTAAATVGAAQPQEAPEVKR